MVVCICDSLSAVSGDGNLLTDPPPRLGWTPFHAACTFNQPDCAGALALAGCDVGVKDRKTGLTGQQIAEKEGHTAVVERLRAVVAEQLRAARAAAEPEPERERADQTRSAEEASGLVAAKVELAVAGVQRGANRYGVQGVRVTPLGLFPRTSRSSTPCIHVWSTLSACLPS
jgi:hypothetical protein